MNMFCTFHCRQFHLTCRIFYDTDKDVQKFNWCKHVWRRWAFSVVEADTYISIRIECKRQHVSQWHVASGWVWGTVLLFMLWVKRNIYRFMQLKCLQLQLGISPSQLAVELATGLMFIVEVHSSCPLAFLKPCLLFVHCEHTSSQETTMRTS